MGAAKKQRTIDYFQQQGQIEIATRVAEIVKRVNEKESKKKESEEVKLSEEKQDEVADTIK